MSLPTVSLRTKQSGFSLVEIILATTIFGILMTAIMAMFIYGQETANVAQNKGQAVLLAKEGVDTLTAMRNVSNALPDDGTYGIDTTVTPWQLSSTPDTISNFTRSITVETIDEHTKKISVHINWSSMTRSGADFAIATYLTDWRTAIAVP